LRRDAPAAAIGVVNGTATLVIVVGTPLLGLTFSLPGGGRLLVVSRGDGHVWLVSADGSRRVLGRYADAEWSPHGLYVVATAPDAVTALDPEGRVRWTLARRDARSPRWEGTRLDTRIAYLTAGGLRVVAGDGTGDRLLAAGVARTAPAWDPARLHTLAYVAHGTLVLQDVDTGRIAWRVRLDATPSALAWSDDGRRLAAVSPHSIFIVDRNGRETRTATLLENVFTEAAFRPRTHLLAAVERDAGRSVVRLLRTDGPIGQRLVFAGAGRFGDLAWSPGGRWLLVDWRSADQWVFLRGARVRAVANIARQFVGDERREPRLELAGRWCC
jgi:dipeptidyl aminopeptidase/acylaminoacyl peptidase